MRWYLRVNGRARCGGEPFNPDTQSAKVDRCEGQANLVGYIVKLYFNKTKQIGGRTIGCYGSLLLIIDNCRLYQCKSICFKRTVKR